VRLTIGGGAGLALSGLLDLSAVKAANENLKLANVSEFTTSCNFCSCGCGMIAAVREDKLIAMEGDYDHIVNRGSLCVKGISMFATHASPDRLAKPRYRAPGADRWVDISWDEAVDRIAQTVRKTRDSSWIATEKLGDRDVPVNRTDAFFILAGLSWLDISAQSWMLLPPGAMRNDGFATTARLADRRRPWVSCSALIQGAGDFWCAVGATPGGGSTESDAPSVRWRMDTG